MLEIGLLDISDNSFEDDYSWRKVVIYEEEKKEISNKYSYVPFLWKFKREQKVKFPKKVEGGVGDHVRMLLLVAKKYYRKFSGKFTFTYFDGEVPKTHGIVYIFSDFAKIYEFTLTVHNKLLTDPKVIVIRCDD